MMREHYLPRSPADVFPWGVTYMSAAGVDTDYEVPEGVIKSLLLESQLNLHIPVLLRAPRDLRPVLSHLFLLKD